MTTATLPVLFCPTCDHFHMDPRLRDPKSEVSIDFAGSQRICMVYARWIAEAIMGGRNVQLRRLGPQDANVIIEGYAPPSSGTCPHCLAPIGEGGCTGWHPDFKCDCGFEAASLAAASYKFCPFCGKPKR